MVHISVKKYVVKFEFMSFEKNLSYFFYFFISKFKSLRSSAHSSNLDIRHSGGYNHCIAWNYGCSVIKLGICLHKGVY